MAGHVIPASAPTIDLVIEYGYTDFNDAAAWLRDRLGLETDPGGSDVPPDAATSKAKGKGAVRLEHFVAYMPMHTYIFAPTREPWPAAALMHGIPPQPLYGPDGKPKLDGKGKPVVMLASRWIDKRQPVEQMTWAPGLPMKIEDRLVAEGGWIEHKGVTTFNLYRPPAIIPGDPNDVKPWLDHLHKIYPDDAEHILNWLAHRVKSRTTRSTTAWCWAACKASAKIPRWSRSARRWIGNFKRYHRPH